MDQNVTNRLANPVNHVAQAYEQRTAQLDQKREKQEAKDAAVQRQRDNDMLRVFEFAGDGMINEAKTYAQQKGIEVPDQIYQNADFAKGLTLAGKIYGDDPAAAQKFTTAWMATPQGDLRSRVAAAQQAAGVPMSADDRYLQRQIALEEWKLKNLPGKDGGFSLSPGQTRYDAAGNVVAQAPQSAGGFKDNYLVVNGVAYTRDSAGNLTPATTPQPPLSRFEAGQKAYNEVMSGAGSLEMAEAARQDAYRYWDQEFSTPQSPEQQQPSAGLVGGGADSGAPTMPPMQAKMQGVYAVQQLISQGYSKEQIQQQLMQRGATPQQIQELFNETGM